MVVMVLDGIWLQVEYSIVVMMHIAAAAAAAAAEAGRRLSTGALGAKFYIVYTPYIARSADFQGREDLWV